MIQLKRGSIHEKRFIGTYKTQQEAAAEIAKILDKEKYEVYYYRYVGMLPKEVMIDYGSHYDFFYMEGTEEEN